MIRSQFPDRETERKALGYLIGRYSGKVLGTGVHLVPEAAVESLADHGVPFTVLGKATYEQQLTALRDLTPATV